MVHAHLGYLHELHVLREGGHAKVFQVHNDERLAHVVTRPHHCSRKMPTPHFLSQAAPDNQYIYVGYMDDYLCARFTLKPDAA